MPSTSTVRTSTPVMTIITTTVTTTIATIVASGSTQLLAAIAP
ncbi:MAG: hypothetical protein ACLQVI_41380 [Polyangiaceae bacterium]